MRPSACDWASKAASLYGFPGVKAVRAAAHHDREPTDLNQGCWWWLPGWWEKRTPRNVHQPSCTPSTPNQVPTHFEKKNEVRPTCQRCHQVSRRVRVARMGLEGGTPPTHVTSTNPRRTTRRVTGGPAGVWASPTKTPAPITTTTSLSPTSPTTTRTRSPRPPN